MTSSGTTGAEISRIVLRRAEALERGWWLANSAMIALQSHCLRTLVLSAVIGLRIGKREGKTSRMGKEEHG